MPRVVAALLQKAASVAAVDHECDTALHDAATYADSACLQHLLHASASPSARNFLDETPLCLAVDTSDNPLVVSLLLEHRWPEAWPEILVMLLRRISLCLPAFPASFFATCTTLRRMQVTYHIPVALSTHGDATSFGQAYQSLHVVHASLQEGISLSPTLPDAMCVFGVNTFGVSDTWQRVKSPSRFYQLLRDTRQGAKSQSVLLEIF